MKKINTSRYSASLIVLLISFHLFTINGFTQNYGWAKNIGGPINWGAGNSVVVDASRNVYTTGSFNLTADFDPGAGVYNLTSLGALDIFVSKLDSLGNFIWARRMGGSVNDDEGLSIAIDNSGNVYVCGVFHRTADFGTFNLTTRGVGYTDIFITKLDSSGNFLWAKSIGGTNYEGNPNIGVDNWGGVYISGVFRDTADFNPDSSTFNLVSKGGDDIFISKLDSSGNFIWAKSMGGTGSELCRSLSIGDSGSVYTTGVFIDTADFDPGTGTFNLISSGGTDIFVSKIDSSGNFVWAKSMGGTYIDYSSSIVVSDSGNVYTTGYFKGTSDFDPGIGTFNLISTNISNYDIFISKLDASGNFNWAKRIGGTSTSGDFSTSIAVDDSENVYTTGYFRGTVDFDPGAGIYNLSASAVSDDIFISKLDYTGSFVWARKMGGVYSIKSFSIALDDLANVYTTGFFYRSADFDPGAGRITLHSAGGQDVFISKLICPSTGSEFITACNSYTWIDSITYTSSTNSPTYTLTNVFGCDSVVTLDLTINSNDTTATVSNDTIMANQQGAAYQWLNCDSSFSRISGATNQIYTPSINGFFACEVSQNGCVDTTACVQMLVTGIDKTDISKSFKLYPNPFTNQLIIEAKGIQRTTSIEVLNVKGQLVYEGIKGKDAYTVLNTTDWSKGIYFIRLINEEGVGTFKLVHQ